MREWATEAPRSAGGVVAYIELATSIIIQEMRTDVDGEGVFPTASFDDLAFAAQMLGSSSQGLNARDIEDGVREERAMRAAAGASARSTGRLFAIGSLSWRTNAICLWRKISKAMSSERALTDFAYRHYLSLDWLISGDLRGRLRMARCAREGRVS